MHVQCNTISLPSINTIAQQMFCGSKYDAPYHHFTVIMTLTPPMTLHTRPTVALFYCHHDHDPSNDPTHQAHCHPVLLSSWPWPLQWPYTPGPLSPCFTVIMIMTPPMILHTRPTVTLFYCHHDPDPSSDPTHQAHCHPVLLSSWPWPLQWSYTPGPLSPCFTVIMTLTPPMILHTRPTVTLFYCHHDPDTSIDPTHQAHCHPVLLSSWPWPLQWSYTPGTSPCFTVIMIMTPPVILHTRPIPHTLDNVVKTHLHCRLSGNFFPRKWTLVLFQVTITQFYSLCTKGTAEQAKKSYSSLQLGESWGQLVIVALFCGHAICTLCVGTAHHVVQLWGSQQACDQ